MMRSVSPCNAAARPSSARLISDARCAVIISRAMPREHGVYPVAGRYFLQQKCIQPFTPTASFAPGERAVDFDHLHGYAKTHARILPVKRDEDSTWMKCLLPLPHHFDGRTAVAAAAFSDSILPGIGMMKCCCEASSDAFDSPAPSLPMAKASLPRRLQP